MFDLIKYKELVDNFNDYLMQIPEEISDIKLSDDSWTLKEIIGHLIDSASNNHQRFVRLQFDDLLGFPTYDAEYWVKCQNYSNMNWKNLITLWYSYNCVILDVIKYINPNSLQNVWTVDEDAYRLEFLVNDYYEHLQLHIDHLKKREQEVLMK